MTRLTDRLTDRLAAGRRARVLVAHARLRPDGGEGAVIAWMLQGLRERHGVTLPTGRPPDLAALNRRFGTSLRPADVATVLLPLTWHLLSRLDPNGAANGAAR